jgi:hypothetical protein
VRSAGFMVDGGLELCGELDLGLSHEARVAACVWVCNCEDLVLRSRLSFIIHSCRSLSIRAWLVRAACEGQLPESLDLELAACAVVIMPDKPVSCLLNWKRCS